MVATQIFLMINPNFGEDEPIFYEHIFQRGLVQPPTTSRIYLKKGGKVRKVRKAMAMLFPNCRKEFLKVTGCDTSCHQSFFSKVGSNPVDGNQKSSIHQLRLVVYPIIYRDLYIPGGEGFHQQYLDGLEATQFFGFTYSP